MNVERMEKYTKGPSYDGARALLIGDGLVTSVGREWKTQRKLLSPFFTPKAVRGYAPLMMEDAEWFTRRWESRAGGHEPVEMLSEMAALTASVILKSLFSTTAQDVREQLQDAVETMIQYTSGRQLNRFRPPEWVPTPARREYEIARDRLDEFVLRVITERRELPADQRPADLLSQIMSGESTLSDRLLRDQCVTMLIAGHESTARTLAFVWYVLATNPEVAANLHDEIDALPQDISLEDLKDAPYFTHRHRDFWENPEKFDPQRWADDAEHHMHPYAFHPFAGGSRVCIGKSFTFMETHLLVILLARRFAPVTVPNYRLALADARRTGTRQRPADDDEGACEMRITPFWLNTRAYARILKVVTKLNTWIYLRTDGRRAAQWNFFGSFRKDPLPIAVLTTVGRKSGAPRTVAVVYLPMDDDRIAFAASHCGQESLPNWFRNIQQNPDVTVQIAGRKVETWARILEPGSDERARTWSLLARKNREFAWMQRWAEREVPVLICDLNPARVQGVGIV